MSNDKDKFKNSKRRYSDEIAMKRQVKIIKTHGLNEQETINIKPHKFSKSHAMNCGDPKCFLCGNPRKFFKEQTIQEKRMFQDLDKKRDKHSNGIEKNDEE